MPGPNKNDNNAFTSPASASGSGAFRVKAKMPQRRMSGGQWLGAAAVSGFMAVSVWLVDSSQLQQQHQTRLDQVRERGSLIMLTRNGASSYFTGAEGETGPEYELADEFARYLGVELEVRVADVFSGLADMLENGEGDMIAANLTRTPERVPQFRFGPSYAETRTLVVFRRDLPQPRTLEDLAGLNGAVLDGSSYAQLMLEAQAELPQLGWQARSESSIEDLLLELDEGSLDYTLIDERIFNINRQFYPNVGKGFAIREAQPLAWAFARDDDDSLSQQATLFMQQAKADGTLLAIQEEFFKPQERLDRIGMMRFIERVRKRLPPWLPLFQEVAGANNLDWRLLAAMGYQESHWDPAAVSPTGVRGLMMLTRNTANLMGIKDREDPLESIKGGARYFVYLRDKLPERIAEPDRTWMALAAYNMGYGHLEDARVLTQRHGGNPDLWSDVSENLALLSQKRYYSEARHGYARSRQALHYVHNIRRYYETLAWMDTRAHPLLAANNTPAP